MVNTRLFKELRETAGRTISSKKRTRFRTISEFHGFSQDAAYEDEGRITKIQFWSTVCKMDLVPSPSKRLETRRSIQCVPRGIKTCNQRSGQHRAVRIGTDDPNRPVSFNTCWKVQPSVLVTFVFDLMKQQ